MMITKIWMSVLQQTFSLVNGETRMHAKEKAWGHTLRFQIKAQQDQSTHLLACLLAY